MKMNIVYLVLIMFLSTACSNDEIEESDIAVITHSEDGVTIDIDIAIDNVTKEVNHILSDAQLGFFSFTGQCQTLSKFEGEIFVSFTQARWTIFGQRIFRANADLDTVEESMNISIQDETEYYPNTDLLTFDGKPIVEIASIVTDYLSSIRKCDGLVVLQKSLSDGPWVVRCGPPEEVFIHCIEIDPVSGQVRDLDR